MHKLSFCTYTHDDGPLLDGLIPALEHQTRRPDEVLIIDDGSHSPYKPPETDLPLRVVRFDLNRGNTFVRTFAVNESKGDIIACMDCDIRPSNNWLEACMNSLTDPGVGLASGTLIQNSGDDPVSKYLELYGDRFMRTGSVDFIPGGCWIIEKTTWNAVGGFGDYREPIRQDNVLCARLKERGYRLWVDSEASASQIRSMSRAAAAAKLWRRFDVTIKAALPQVPEDDFPRFFYESLGLFMLRRTAQLIEKGLPALFIIELTYMMHMLLDLIDHAETTGLYGPGLKASLMSRTRELLDPFPKLQVTLLRDLAELGHQTASGPADHAYWRPLFDKLDQLRDAGVFAAAQANLDF